jgi:prephenate dehydratase
MKVAYLGPAGTFTEAAALRYDPSADLVPCATIPAVAAAIREGAVEKGVAPVENSLQGAVTDTLDVLIHEDGVLVHDELVLPITHDLMGKPETRLDEVRIVYSHPQALGQCREYLQRHLSKAEPRAALSTAAAVEDALRSDVVALAIAPRRAAEIYGAQIMAEGIQDNSNNATRFLVLARQDHERTGEDKTSIGFSFADDRPGLLFSVMKLLAERDINLSKVESRPTREGLGQYYFLLDLVGHREDAPVRDALEQVGELTSMLKVFGSYPRTP